ncbi:nitrate- and nitrite sensing domain-containing protein [Streptomyces sp. NBC_01239]|uniref:sensor histidine kinase n=1 Tax=Streptomyces sp. NBC_01239 TaxID=2903792 RepID=UPI002256E78E|nr:nitrate- and nitrite sensing domain-containing protein [Streptomyces sp. NBC_01239]MCX4815233.1 nitrate- and nitrite sensing domain-containing protein [Streptomyces sp. NBC_01239]
MRIRPSAGGGRSIRVSLIVLALVPAAGMVVLWFSGSAVLYNQYRQADEVGQAAKTTYALVPGVAEFQKERQLTVELLSSHASRAALDAQRSRTDAILADFHEADSVSADDGTAQYQAQLATVRKRLDDLTAERTAVDGGEGDRRHAYTVYSDAIGSVLNLFGTLSTDDGSGATAAEAAHALSFLRATEALAGERAILDGAAASGKLSVQERATLASAAAVRSSTLTNEVAPYLPEKMRAALEKVTASRDWQNLQSAEAAIPSAADAGEDTIDVPHVTAARAAAPGRVFTQVQTVENEYLGQVTQNSEDRNHELFTRVMLGSALALAAVFAVAVLSWRITRSLIGRMSSLREATLDLADNRLPELIRRLRADGKGAEDVEIPELAYGDDELGKVAHAFNSAQRTAVAVALEQAALREGARLVFLNMSRRTQVLVHRQLTVIDAMERKEQDPQLLAELYRVDHLATRMRRNAESLTVLSGSTPRRRWREAVSLDDLLRSAVSEVEGYTRVVVEPMPPIAVTGPAVGDTIHLMAELIENGVTFSPPHTDVRVRVLPVAQGYAIEVEDRGLGLSAQEYEAANALLHHPQEFNITSLGEDPRLGLFTVGHLAQRHGITASLQPSSYGGSLAVVVLPQNLTEPVADSTPLALDPRAERHLASVAVSEGAYDADISTRTRTAPAAPTGLAQTSPPVAVPAPVGPPAVPPVAGAGSRSGGAPAPGPRPGGASRLPRRVRQANLAPQLLQRHEEPDHVPSREAEERRPEQARSMLAALRDGTRRARAQEDIPAPAWPTTPTGRRPLPTRSSTRNSTS